MQTLKSISFISVEGFWTQSVHDQRMIEAAEKLHSNPQAFAIATATHAPAPCVSFTKMPLGKYTANKLIEKYNISPARILPAYLFDQKTTYTIIDAYSNAIMIGWLSCGLTKRETKIKIELTPTTAGFHAQAARILTLNERSLASLENLNVDASITPPSEIMNFKQLLSVDSEEAGKLTRIKEPGGLLNTGAWNTVKWDGDNGIAKNFDNIEDMRTEITKAFSLVFGHTFNDYILFQLSDLQRVLLTMVWNIKANTNNINDNDWNHIYTHINSFFTEQLETNCIDQAKAQLSEKGLI